MEVKNYGDTENIITNILETSLDLFKQKGFHATNMQDISDLLKISRMPIYYHFKNKFILYEETVKYYLEEKNNAFSKIFESDLNIFDKIGTDLILCSKKGLGELILFMDIDNIPEFINIKQMRWNSYKLIYDLKINATNAAIQKNELRSGINIEEFVNHIYILYYGIMGMSQSPFHNLSLGNSEKLFDTLIQGMISKYS